MKVYRGLVLSDLQFPQHNPRLLQPLEQLMADYKWDFLIYLGDLMDMDAISHYAHENGNLRSLEGKRLKKDYQALGAILERHRALVGPKCQITYFMGNHEEWAEKLVDKYPGLEGLIEVEHNLPFAKLKIEVIPPRHHKKIGKLYFVHGDIATGAYQTANHAKKMVDTYNRNVVYGHHHSLQVYTKISPVGINETHSAFCIPALADIQPGWAQDKPNAWLNGFAIFDISATRFTVYPIVAVHNGFIFNQREYT